MRTEEFELWAAASADRLYRAAWLLTNDHGAAQDLVQDTLERVLRRWRRIEDPFAVAHVTLGRLAVDRWRRRGRRPERLSGDLPDTAAAKRPASVGIDLQRALAELPSKQREVVVLRYVLDASEATTAEALGISTGTVKSHASRGLARLRDLLSTMEETT